ncbi:30S ribosomal protein S9 [Acetomicrobium hydrogeniformans]|uniref:Small ribosomal subunit protein uS9 n=1 Tax=Acetomicrobium hydrogeniformans TaxID=649746 RepID=A0A7V7BYK1_9BACT|nr:30S ribosomal protein S9 [Acetomicrobium hydrogeniformans]HHZ04696.1 30S ribosomal protein S9 [Acetomicrobium hydrogeniformans]
MPSPTYYWGTGRRKESIARVRIRPGEGQIVINGRSIEDYFPRQLWRLHALEPLKVSGMEGKIDVFIKAQGGGLSGQAGAVRLGIARALLTLDPEMRPVLKKADLLARDPRMVERKKFGRRKARALYQYSKR